MSTRLTAMDVAKQDFTRKMRGFDPDEVTLFLKAVAEEIERLNLDRARRVPGLSVVTLRGTPEEGAIAVLDQLSAVRD